jgi:glycosyltransferase involved in cell wall biosynthesis
MKDAVMYDTTTQGHVAERTTANDLPIASTSPLPADQERTPSPRRILFVTARYFPLIGGTETHTFEIARRMKMLGHDGTVLTTNPGRRLPAEEVVGGVPVIRVPAWPIDRDYYFAPSLVRVIKDGQWDIVHCQGYHTLVRFLSQWGILSKPA